MADMSDASLLAAHSSALMLAGPIKGDELGTEQRIALAQVYATLAVADAIERTARQPAVVEPAERTPPPCPEHQVLLLEVGEGLWECRAAGCRYGFFGTH